MGPLLLIGAGVLAYAAYRNFTEKAPLEDGNPFTRWYTYGTRASKMNGEKAGIVFVDKATGKRKTIVSSSGSICNFPGMVKEECWTSYLSGGRMPAPVVNFRSDIDRYDDEKYIMIWQIQPDGRFWEDNTGFGSEDDFEIRLYTFIDQNGNFTGPFRVYNVGTTNYFERNSTIELAKHVKTENN